MKHHVKILLLIMAMIAAAALGIVLVLPLVGNKQELPQTTATYAVTQYTGQEIAQIEVQNLSGDRYALLLSGSFATATVSGLSAQVPLHEGMAAGIAQKFAQCVSYSPPIPVAQDTLAEYGLDRPKATFVLMLADGSTKTLLLGNETVTKNGYYLYLQGEANAYIVEYAYYNYAGYAATDYINTVLAQVNQDNDFKITSLSLQSKASGQTISIEQKGADNPISRLSINTYLVTSPLVFDASDENIKTHIFQHLTALRALGVHSLDCSAEQLQRLGFDQPDHTLTFTAEGKETSLRFVRQEDQTLLAICNDIPVVYTVDGALNDLLDITLDQVVSPFLTLQGITEIDSFVVEGSQQQYAFSLQQEQEALTVQYQDKLLDTDSFRRLYSMAAQIDIRGVAEAPLQQEQVLGLTYKRKDGTDTVVQFFAMDGRFCFATVNGTGHFKVLLSDIQAFEKALVAYTQGESLVN